MDKPILSPDDEIKRFFSDPEAVRLAIQKGINAALLKHKQLGFPVCEWRDGKVVWIQPEDININNL